MSGYSYVNGGGWTSCGWGKAPPNDSTVLLWGQPRTDVRLWKWTGELPGNWESPLIVATNDDRVLHTVANIIGHILQNPGRELAQRHQDHYRFCNCLADSAECCVLTCPCHATGVTP